MFPPSDGKPELMIDRAHGGASPNNNSPVVTGGVNSWRDRNLRHARLGSPWISSHSSIRVPTAALEAEALAGLLCGRPRD